MQGSDQKEAGFGAVGVLVVAVALIVMGFVGWRVYDSRRDKQNQAVRTSTNQAQSSGDEVSSVKYLDIKELGIKLKLSSDIEDAVYYYDTTSKYPLVRVSTQSLIDRSNGTCAPKVSSPFGSIRKTQDVSQPDGSTLTPNGNNVFQFGSDYFVYATPNQTCSSDKDVIDLETAQLASFKEAIRTIQPDK
jgi:hypothetical protein